MKKIILIMLLIIIPKQVKAEYIQLTEETNHSNSYNNLIIVDKDNSTNKDQGDPFIIKEKKTFYLFTTGNRYWTSSDLVDWQFKGEYLNQESKIFDRYWAPEIYKHENKYYMLYTGVQDIDTKRDLQLAQANNLNDKFINIAELNTNKFENNNTRYNSIDGNILFEGNKKYLYFRYYKTQGTYVAELNDDFSLKEEPKELIKVDKSWESGRIEGPYVFKKNNKYYITYSSGSTSTPMYAVGYAVSNNPKGPFEKEIDEPLLYGTGLKNEKYNTDYVVNGTGHNMVYEDEEGQTYIVYHGQIDINGTRSHRKLMLDYMGIDEDGKLFVNGTSVDNQPLPSGIRNLHYLNDNYTIKSNGNIINELSDKIDYNCKTKTANIINSKNLEITVPNKQKIKNIWLFGTNEGFNNEIANIIINNKYIINNINLGNEPTREIQLPNIEDKIEKIEINVENEIKLTELKLYNEKATEEQEISTEPTTEQETKEELIVKVPSTSKNIPTYITLSGILLLTISYFIKKHITKKEDDK